MAAAVEADVIIGAVASSVKLNAPEVLTLPAASVWRTTTDLAPSPVKAKLLPVPVVQSVPLLVLYSQVAPISMPVTLTTPLLVLLSPTMPVSPASAKVGADGASMSTACTLCVAAALLLAAISIAVFAATSTVTLPV